MWKNKVPTKKEVPTAERKWMIIDEKNERNRRTTYISIHNSRSKCNWNYKGTNTTLVETHTPNARYKDT